jgi:hypothetical protein
VRPAAIVEVEITADRRAGLGHAVIGLEIHLLVFDASPESFDEDVVAPRPLPSMLMAIPLLASTPVDAAPVNCEPWSVLKIAGLPCFASASSSVSMQNAASIVIDTRHDRTRRLNQSSTTAR